jgi:hypothetical protein
MCNYVASTSDLFKLGNLSTFRTNTGIPEMAPFNTCYERKGDLVILNTPIKSVMSLYGKKTSTVLPREKVDLNFSIKIIQNAT